MALYGVTAVGLDALGRVVRARLQQADGQLNQWVGEPSDLEASEVANMIVTGDQIYSIIPTQGGTVAGPKFRRVVFEHGIEGVELERDVEGQRLQDLKRL